MASLYQLDYEKQFLSALIRNPALRGETTHINDRDFSEVNRPVMQAIDACIASGVREGLQFVVIQKLNSMNLKIGGVLEAGAYIKSLVDLLGVNDAAAIDIAKQLKRVTVMRELHSTATEMANAVLKNHGKGALEMVADATALFNKKVNLLGGGGDDDPKDLYGTIDLFLDGATQYETRSVATPFPIYNDLYGFLDPGNLYVMVARMKVGKSTWLQSLLQQLSLDDKNGCFRALILDTELTVEELQSRIISSITGVSEFYIRHKWYRKNREMREKVDAARETIKPLFAKVTHAFIGGMSLEQQLSIARRWYFKNIHGTNCKGLIGLDYFKLNSSGDFAGGNARDIVIGQKVDAYKNLAKELGLPIWAFVQANRGGEDTKDGARLTNSSIISGSDMLAQFASNVYLLEKLSTEEKIEYNLVSEDGPTHSLKLIVPRQLGPNEMGQDGLVKYIDDKGKPRFADNFVLYRFDRFNVKEMGTFKQLMQRNSLHGVNVQPKPEPIEGAPEL